MAQAWYELFGNDVSRSVDDDECCLRGDAGPLHYAVLHGQIEVTVTEDHEGKVEEREGYSSMGGG